jgi:hypothetical protein
MWNYEGDQADKIAGGLMKTEDTDLRLKGFSNETFVPVLQVAML